MTREFATILLIIIYAISGILCLGISSNNRKLGKKGDGWIFCSGFAFAFMIIMFIHLFNL